MTRSPAGLRPAFLILGALGLAALAGCPGPSKDRNAQLRAAAEQEGDFMAEEFWIYATLPPEVVRVLEPYLRREFPNLDVKWLPGDEAAVAAKLSEEVAANQVKADLILLSDPFLVHALRSGLKLMSYRSLHAKDIAEAYRDAEGYYAAAGAPFVVIVYNPETAGLEKAPKAFVDLAAPDWGGKVAIADPAKSAAGFALAAALSRRYGWDYFRQMKANGARIEAGDAAVVEAVASKRAAVGAATLERVLAAKKEGKVVDFLYPEEGPLPVPEYLAIPANSRKPEVAKTVYDFLLSKTAQDAIVSGFTHSPQPEIAAPLGAKPWGEMAASAMIWNPRYVGDVAARREAVASKFAEIMAN